MKQLECPNCKQINGAIETGETSLTQELIEYCMENKWDT